MDRLLTFARTMRKNMTPYERKLWYDFLSKYSVRIVRQKIFGHYILDFYCKQAKVAIELDGSQHYKDIGKRNVLSGQNSWKNWESLFYGIPIRSYTIILKGFVWI